MGGALRSILNSCAFCTIRASKGQQISPPPYSGIKKGTFFKEKSLKWPVDVPQRKCKRTAYFRSLHTIGQIPQALLYLYTILTESIVQPCFDSWHGT